MSSNEGNSIFEHNLLYFVIKLYKADYVQIINTRKTCFDSVKQRVKITFFLSI